MTLVGKVLSAPTNSKGFDSCDPISGAMAKQKVGEGFRFCIRYVPFTQGTDANYTDISAGEAQAIIDAGLGLMIVQHPPSAGWSPNADLGQKYGSRAATHAQSAGIPAGVTVFADLEGVAEGALAQDVIGFCNAWFAAVSAAGYEPGLYVGGNPGLTADQLYHDLTVTHYWKSGSGPSDGVPDDIPKRGYQMRQTIAGGFDSDVTSTDNLGGSVTCVCNPQAVPSA